MKIILSVQLALSTPLPAEEEENLEEMAEKGQKRGRNSDSEEEEVKSKGPVISPKKDSSLSSPDLPDTTVSVHINPDEVPPCRKRVSGVSC